MKWLNGVLILLLILALWQWQFGDGGRQDLREKQQQLADQQTQIDVLELRNDRLAAEVTSLKTGLEAVEERARSELGMIKEGEIFIQVVNPPDSQD